VREGLSVGAFFEIDGARGEGGGQVLRTSLALSMTSARPLRLRNVRAGRPKPGLLRQHLTAVRAAAAICGARVAGDELGSRAVEFTPGPVCAGDYRFAVGSAGSTTLVLQTVLLPLALCGGTSVLHIEGGTHNRSAPTFEFLDCSYLPLLRRMGFDVQARLLRAGYEPAGGGELEVRIGPPGTLHALDLTQRGELGERRGVVRIAHLPKRIAEDERAALVRLLAWPSDSITIHDDASSPGPGNVVSLHLRAGDVGHVFTGFARLGLPARRVAKQAADRLKSFLSGGTAVDEHLADQLLLPMALGAGGRLRMDSPSSHTLTNVALLEDWGIPFGYDPASGVVSRMGSLDRT
jgi:RNA 3'-terminal phosphate cyclase (ATP)